MNFVANFRASQKKRYIVFRKYGGGGGEFQKGTLSEKKQYYLGIWEVGEGGGEGGALFPKVNVNILANF